MYTGLFSNGINFDESTYLIPYLERRSLDKGAVINFLLIWEGAVKCRFLCFLADAETFLFNFMMDLAL